MSSVKRFFIIDAMALAYRSFFAFSRNPLTRSDGLATSAIYGTAMFLRKLLEEEKPDYLSIVTDAPGPTFRHELYKEYKATRHKMPDSLSDQIPLIFELFTKMGFPAQSISGIEADDLIGTLAKKFGKDDVQVYIVSGDKDFMQLINNNIFLYSPKKGEKALIVDEEGVKEKFLCKPDHVIDCLAMIGDTSDNVPGVRGVGEKGAAKLISQYGSLEGIYDHIDEIKNKRQKENLIAEKDNAFLSKELVTIKTDVESSENLEDFVCHPEAALSNDDLLSYYEELEFRQLSGRTVEGGGTSAGRPAKVRAFAPTTEVNSDENLKLLEQALANCKEMGMAPKLPSDLINGHVDEFAVFVDKKIYQTNSDFFVKANQLVAEWLQDPQHKLYIFDYKSLLHCWLTEGVVVKAQVIDLSLLDYLIDPNHQNHQISSLLSRYLGQDSEPEALPEIAAAAFRLGAILEAEAKQKKQLKIYEDIERPLLDVLAKMEKNGIYVDHLFLDQYSEKLDKIAKDLQQKIWQEAGEEFNVNSTKQLQEILFVKLKVHEQLKIKRLKKTKTGFSTDESVMKRLAKHPIADLILQYREVSKIKSTYVDALPQWIHEKSGRLHTRFNQTVAATGRLSSDKPNLQNIPMRTPIGQEIRKAFQPGEKDQVFLSADYSQVEIRLLAHLAKATELIEAFRQGQDIHTVTAAKIFGIAPEAVDTTMRSRAKAVNFGIIYGMGPQRLSQETGVTMSEAKDFIAKYFATFPGIKRYTTNLIQKAKSRGFTETMAGRRRPTIGIGDANRAIAARAENIAVNAPIQGSAADLIKLAMIRIQKDLEERKLRARMLLQVHDELLFECPKDELEELKPIVREGMEHAFETSVPLKVEMGSGANWLEAH